MKNYNSSQGFTIIETLVASVLTLIIAAGLLNLQYLFGLTQVSAINNYLTAESANTAANMFIREVRTARQGENGAFTLEICDDHELSFFSDTNADGSTEKIRYYLDGTDLMKSVIFPTGTPVTYPPENAITKSIASNVRNNTEPIFTYFNEDWPSDITNNPLSTPANLSQVKLIQLYLRTNPDVSSPSSDYVVEDFAQIRTLKSNL